MTLIAAERWRISFWRKPGSVKATSLKEAATVGVKPYKPSQPVAQILAWCLRRVWMVEAEEERATLRWVQLIENALEGDMDNGRS